MGDELHDAMAMIVAVPRGFGHEENENIEIGLDLDVQTEEKTKKLRKDTNSCYDASAEAATQPRRAP